MCYVNHPRIGIWNCHKIFHNIHPTYASAAVHSASYPIVLSVSYILYIYRLYFPLTLSFSCVFHSYQKLLNLCNQISNFLQRLGKLLLCLILLMEPSLSNSNFHFCSLDWHPVLKNSYFF